MALAECKHAEGPYSLGQSQRMEQSYRDDVGRAADKDMINRINTVR